MIYDDLTLLQRLTSQSKKANRRPLPTAPSSKAPPFKPTPPPLKESPPLRAPLQKTNPLSRLLHEEEQDSPSSPEETLVAERTSKERVRAYDVCTSILATLLLAGYGIVRLQPSFLRLPRNGLAAWLSTALPFVFALVFFCSTVYHCSLEVPLASAVLKEFNFAAMFVAISFATITLHVTLSSDPEGGISQLPIMLWMDPLLVASFAVFCFVTQRLRIPPEQTYHRVDDDKDEDSRTIHRNPDEWDDARARMLFVASLLWVTQVELFTKGLRQREHREAPPVAIVQGIATLVFVVAALCDTAPLVNICALRTSETCARTTWHILSLLAIGLTLFNLDAYLLRWQLDGDWEPSTGWSLSF